MVRIIIFLLALPFTSCSESPLEKELSGAQLVSIKFYTAGGELEKTVETDNKDALVNMARFINSETEADRKCPFDGYMEFQYPNLNPRTVQFSLDPECKQFIVEINGKITAHKMSEEAVDFFNSLRSGRDNY